MAVIDANTNALVTRIAVGRGPKGIVLSADYSRAYVANYDDNTVSVIDTKIQEVIGIIRVGYQPFGVAINSAGDRLFVTNQTANVGGLKQRGTVSVVDTVTHREFKRLLVGKEPSGISVAPVSDKVYVANAGSNSVSIIKGGIRNPKVIRTIKVGKRPVAFGDFMSLSATADDHIVPGSGRMVWIEPYSLHMGIYNGYGEKEYIDKSWQIDDFQDETASVSYSRGYGIAVSTCVSKGRFARGGHLYFYKELPDGSYTNNWMQIHSFNDCASKISYDGRQHTIYVATSAASGDSQLFACSDNKDDCRSFYTIKASRVVGIGFNGRVGYILSSGNKDENKKPKLYKFDGEKLVSSLAYNCPSECQYQYEQSMGGVAYDGNNVMSIGDIQGRGEVPFQLQLGSEGNHGKPLINYPGGGVSLMHNYLGGQKPTYISSDRCGNFLIGYDASPFIFDRATGSGWLGKNLATGIIGTVTGFSAQAQCN